MSQYVGAMLVFLIILSPLIIPTGVYVVHAIRTGAAYLGAIASTRGLRLQRRALQPAF